jgi:arylsulfatase
MKKTSRRDFLKAAAVLSASTWPGVAKAGTSPFFSGPRDSSAPPGKPNIILILGDDLGHSELGCYGQSKIRTPHIDGLAKEGVRFTQSYSGSPVCAPSRCVLMTGKHAGHAFIRDNREIQPEGQLPIPGDTVTLPKLLKKAGYATGCVGKWGLGPPVSEGDPNKQGFDLFFGYNCQRHAHNHYPTYLWRNDKKITIEGNDGGPRRKQYAQDLFEAEAMDFIRANKDRPFFLFFATTVPHLALQVPDDSLEEYRGVWDDPPYDGTNGYLPQKYPRAAYAAMVTRLDRSVGRIASLIKQLGLDGETLVLVTSDNGSTYKIGGYDPDFFRGTWPFRAAKGSIYEGGIRIPLIARWPGRIKPARTSAQVVAFQDILPTMLDVAGARETIPADIDGISFWPELLAERTRQAHSHLYMEFAGYGGQVMVRLGDWKAVRKDLIKNPAAPIELYDLSLDIGEKNDVAAKQPDIVKTITGIMKAEHSPSKEFPIPALDGL